MAASEERVGTGDGVAVLGINFSGADPNAALVIDGRIVAAAEEERFVREKHASGRFPHRAVGFCVEAARREDRAIDRVAFGWDCPKYADGTMEEFFEEEVNGRYDVNEGTRRWQRWMLDTFDPDNVTEKSHESLKRHGIEESELPPVCFLSHHRTHAAGAYLLSGFEDAAILTLDGSGEQWCTALWTGRDGHVERQAAFPMPHSLGWYYAAITEYLGFRAYNGEFKVMGLAAYGEPDPRVEASLRKVLAVDEEAGSYELDGRYIHYGAHTWSGRFTDALVELLGEEPREAETEPTPFHKNVAHAAQALLEEAGLALARRAVETAGSRRVCLAGGTALNCKMSQRILESDFVDDVFVLPNAGDGGQALSAAVLACYELTGRHPGRLRSMAMGPGFSDEEIREILDECLLSHDRVEDPAEAAAEDLAAGRIVGWFQGPMEFGPRALGNRSILADPRKVDSRDRVNAVVKYREYWRPFCPSMAAEAADRYFSVRPGDAPFMTITLPVHGDRQAEIEAVVHVDGTARPQLVHGDTHPLYHRLIRAFEERTGVAGVLNTSFNVKGEPIVCTVRDALRNFYSCGLDVLYLGPFRLEKRPRI